MRISIQPTFLQVRLFIAAFWGILCLLAVGAPFLASHTHFAPSSILYLVFSGVCHQIPERSFDIAGFPIAVCHRCSSIYLGLLAGALINNPLISRSATIRRISVLAAILPLLIDGMLSFSGIVTGGPTSRFLTGLLVGTMLSSLFMHGILELQKKWLYCRGGVQ